MVSHLEYSRNPTDKHLMVHHSLALSRTIFEGSIGTACATDDQMMRKLDPLVRGGIVFLLPVVVACFCDCCRESSFVICALLLLGFRVMVCTWRKVLYYVVCLLLGANVFPARGMYLIGLNVLSIVLLWQMLL